MTFTERIILSAIVCMMILAAVVGYEPIDRGWYDQAEISWRLDSYGK